MTATAESLLPSEQDEWNELASIGIVLDGPTTDAQLDAWASEVCRRLAEERAEIERYNEAEAAEIARIQLRYTCLRNSHERRILDLEAIGRDLAERADFGAKKSRDVGFGSYGRRKVPESVKVADSEKAVEWLYREKQGAGVRVKTTESVDVKEAKPIVLAHMISTGEVAPGFEHVAAHDEPFIRAEA